MDPGLLCKTFFTLGIAVDLGGIFIPSFRQQIMNYGSRGSAPTMKTHTEPQGQLGKLFSFIASFQVPHTWFTHYYVVSVVSSIFWGVQMYTRGWAFEYLAAHTTETTSEMTINQVFLAWLFMTLQGIRRLYESITLTKPSQSKMWVGLWLLGIAYYIFIGISVWIEGISE